MFIEVYMEDRWLTGMHSLVLQQGAMCCFPIWPGLPRWLVLGYSRLDSAEQRPSSIQKLL